MTKRQFQGQVIENMILAKKTRNQTVIPNFHGISTGKLIYGIMFEIQGELQSRKGQLQSHISKIVIFNKYK